VCEREREIECVCKCEKQEIGTVWWSVLYERECVLKYMTV
jgi:hypothetical protein